MKIDITTKFKFAHALVMKNMEKQRIMFDEMKENKSMADSEIVNSFFFLLCSSLFPTPKKKENEML